MKIDAGSRVVVAAVLAAWSIGASATPIAFDITGGSASTYGVTAGSTVSVTPSANLALQDFALEVGQTSSAFNFLDVTVTGQGLVAGYVNAALNFSSPTIATADGVLAGFSVILGWASGGSLMVLDDPGPIAFGDGGLFDVDFFGFSDSCRNCNTLSGHVTATVSLLRTPATSVPEPATLSLLGAGLLAIGLSRRRRRQQA